MCEATGKNEASIKKSYEEHGDLGVVVVGARSTQRTMFAPPPLTIASVLKAFQNIAQVLGCRGRHCATQGTRDCCRPTAMGLAAQSPDTSRAKLPMPQSPTPRRPAPNLVTRSAA